MQHVRGVEHQAQQAVEAVGSHVHEVEPRASELLAQMQSNHQRELNEVQAVANQAYQEIVNENCALNQ